MAKKSGFKDTRFRRLSDRSEKATGKVRATPDEADAGAPPRAAADLRPRGANLRSRSRESRVLMPDFIGFQRPYRDKTVPTIILVTLSVENPLFTGFYWTPPFPSQKLPARARAQAWRLATHMMSGRHAPACAEEVGGHQSIISRAHACDSVPRTS